jgi:uncharacterized membrane-anchored protein
MNISQMPDLRDITADSCYIGKAQLYGLMAIMIGTVVAFIGIYNSASGIDKEEIDAENNSPKLKKAKETEFIVMIVLACVAIVISLVATGLLKNNNWKFLSLAITGSAIIGLCYSVGIKLRNNKKAKLGLSITILIISLFIAVFVGLSGPTIISGTKIV